MPPRREIEDLLFSAAESERGAPRVAREVYARLQFLARMLRAVPVATGARCMLLWLDERGEVAWVGLGSAPVVVGRDSTCHVVLLSSRVSRRHCTVGWSEVGGEGLVLEDLGSSNGTRVNGRAISLNTAYPLHDGDVIEVGSVALAIVIAPEIR